MKLNVTRSVRCRVEAAYNLPEVIMGMLLIGVMLVSLYAGFSSGFALMQSARENLRATQIILQRLESLRLYRWSQVLDTTNYLKPTFVAYYDPLDATNPAPGLVYAGYIHTNPPAGVPVSASYRTNLIEVTVTVYWTNYIGGKEIVRARNMQTYVARYGMQNYIPGK